MNFEKKPLIWKNEGVEPSETLAETGFVGGYKPPAATFNYMFHQTGEAITELQAGLSNVDNTSDLDKPVSTAVQKALDGKLNADGGNISAAITIPGLTVGSTAEENGPVHQSISVGEGNWVNGCGAMSIGESCVAYGGVPLEVESYQYLLGTIKLKENPPLEMKVGDEILVLHDVNSSSDSVVFYKSEINEINGRDLSISLDSDTAVSMIIWISQQSLDSTANVAIGEAAIAAGSNSVAEGYFTIAKGKNSHAEGNASRSIGINSHAEGDQTRAEGESSHTEGYFTTARGKNSHAGGFYTLATAENATIIGQYGTTNDDTLFAVANGTSTQAQSLALDVTKDGTVKIPGKLEVAGKDISDIFDESGPYAPLESPTFTGVPKVSAYPSGNSTSARLRNISLYSSDEFSSSTAFPEGELIGVYE